MKRRFRRDEPKKLQGVGRYNGAPFPSSSQRNDSIANIRVEGNEIPQFSSLVVIFWVLEQLGI